MTRHEQKLAAIRQQRFRDRRKEGRTVITWAMDPCVLIVLEDSGVLPGWAEDPQVIIEALDDYFDLVSGKEKKERRKKEQQNDTHHSTGA